MPVTGDEQRNLPSLDQLWDQIRKRKERQEAKRPTKVKSLETAPAAPSGVSRSPPDQSAMQRKVTPPQLKRKKSIVSYRESHDGRTKTAIFDLPGVKKHHMHISFRSDQGVTVEWTTVKITETEEDGRLVRERKEKIYTRTIPVPQGTKFEEICATMDNSRLILTYPNMRTVRVERRKYEFGHGEPRRIEPTEVESTDVYEY
ncbi:hypothetical protein EDD16DRAFT_1474582 [Pisolithus croceorrhizus]|nr:hypothetical protein EDD16DRAFT_1474582 [Pisolithus croceorrhizus]KAI6168164.1 hypothetical protein EDD17DRAFT_1466744 [Pisolithus thermaeus]